ncbi:PHA/PHB synthase family protein [Alcaligenes sp. GCM10023179]|uniref:PHA/PHB synthase family protein n=1 Tax=Alcaligenes sp. GCM10023179 TaxID=3252633 RepID=UPI0036138B4B
MVSRQSLDQTEQLDASARAAWARIWSSISAESQFLAWMDWIRHLALSPGKQEQLRQLAQSQWEQLFREWSEELAASAQSSLQTSEQAAAPAYTDRRFSDPAWDRWPFNLLRQTYQAQQQWWQSATEGVAGVEPHHQKLIAFGAEQWLNMLSPSNFAWTNPLVWDKTLAEQGDNFSRGLENWQQDMQAQFAGEPPVGTEDFVVGKDVAATPGKVVLRNELVELIQYTPSTKQVHPEPVLIVPAWIMKYYILDLSEQNSLIKYLVDQGHTVFCLSWKNPLAEDHAFGMDDYIRLGWKASLDAVNAIVPGQKIHATGYCLGGTLLAIAAAAMARDGDDRLASLTFFAAQTDFSEPGDLSLFIDESQVSLLEAQMADEGYLRANQMEAAFQMLRSADLLWAPMVNKYLLGERRPLNDLMAWNADATRMPATMHSQYLRRMYLNNDLSQNRYPVEGRIVSLAQVNLPIFCVGTVSDHVAPWRSVYKLHYLVPAEITFVLTTGGHNAGIVSEPGHPRRKYQIQTRAAGTAPVLVDDWQAKAASHQGSWWPAWTEWLKARSGAEVKPPQMGAAKQGYAPIGPAPGQYVLVK